MHRFLYKRKIGGYLECPLYRGSIYTVPLLEGPLREVQLQHYDLEFYIE